jgi:hypothetical protein
MLATLLSLALVGQIPTPSGPIIVSPSQGMGCGSGQSLCSGSCSTLATDSANCGACGVVCSKTQVCSASSCVAAAPYGYITVPGGAGTAAWPASVPTPLQVNASILHPDPWLAAGLVLCALVGAIVWGIE